jgi:(5-formylfuran-3-yl)methyl phosphate synthase
VQLLVSVRDAQEAASAVAGEADIVDAKNPAAGPLGAVSLDVLRAIVGTVGGLRPVTAALGDAADEDTVEADAASFAQAGAALIKVGFAGIGNPARARALLASAARGAGAERVIAVAYADYRRAGSLSPLDVLSVADAVHVAGVLLDTADKQGPRLRHLVPAAALGEWVVAVRRVGLLAALAGRLVSEDIDDLRSAGADIVGVRGAACDGGRDGCVSAEKVRLLKGRVHVSRADPVEGWLRTDP